MLRLELIQERREEVPSSKLRAPRKLQIPTSKIAGVWSWGVLWSLMLAAWSLPAVAASLPNIIFIVSDDQGWRDIGYHNTAFITPNLDKLAATGVRLDHHYVFPTCSPTRCAILSGRNPARFGILTPIAGTSKLTMPSDIPNLASMLKSRGY